ncbi:hypothetical protein FACS18947_4020 [Bacteroidia bacterium]|nr:hypothetical protein FACS18947_4020 [Bacteroidia bacterium]
MLGLAEVIKILNTDYSVLKLRENESLSLPFYATFDGKAYPAVFIYTAIHEDGGTDFAVKKVCLFLSDDISDFVQKSIDDFPDAKHSGETLQNNQDVSTLDSIEKKYSDTIKLLDAIPHTGKALVEDAKKLIVLLNQVVPNPLMPYYFAIGSDYFQRINELSKNQGESK